MEKLIEKAKTKDIDAIEEVIGKFKYLIFKEASRYFIQGYELEDLVQHGYLSVIKAISMYTLGSNSFNGYCINAIKLNFKALLKGEIKHFRETPSDELLDNIPQNYEFTLEDEVIAYEECKKLYAGLYKLEPEYREIIEKYFILDQSLVEIACDCDKSYHEIVIIKRKALKKLKALM